MNFRSIVCLVTLAAVESCVPTQRSFDDAALSGTSDVSIGGSGGTGEAESVADAASGTGAGGRDGFASDDAILAYARCADLPSTVPSGVYPIKPPGATEALSIYCNTKDAGGGWALLFNSIGSTAGTTTPFWRILYADRFAPKGTPSIKENFYLGQLYIYGAEYRDEIEDIAHKTTEVLHAKVATFDPNTMGFGGTMRVDDYRGEQGSRAQEIFSSQLSAGWSSIDHDGDMTTTKEENCAVSYAGVTQHYSGCWVYNLGADADVPYEDGNWGPHVLSGVAAPLGVATDGTLYTRVSRITRWVRW